MTPPADADLARWEALCAALVRGEVWLRPTRREDAGHLAALTAALPALLAEVRRLRAMLWDVEWAGRRYYDLQVCLFCDGIAPHESETFGRRGHDEACPWGATFREDMAIADSVAAHARSLA